MPSPEPCLVLITTGGTIAGRAASAGENVAYRAGVLGPADLLAGLPAPALAVQAESLVQIDSKDMGHETWRRLAQRVAEHLARAEVQGIVVTHGTDTLEETAWLLQRVLAPDKPVVLTAAMRPASSLQADGPQNLHDALILAAWPGARGVIALLLGSVIAAADLRKHHPYRLDAFDPIDRGAPGPVARVVQGHVQQQRAWPRGDALGLARLPAAGVAWPWVEWLASHAGADGRAVEAWVQAGLQGLVVAGTGNASLHHELEAALERAVASGVAVRLVTRCAAGEVLIGPDHRYPVYAALSPPQARVELMLELMADRARPHA